MDIFQKNGAVAVTANSFNIGETLECGQCFRFEKTAEGDYINIVRGQAMRIRQQGQTCLFSLENGTIHEMDFRSAWVPYYDLDRNYDIIKDVLSANDLVMRDATEYAPGIRLLAQEPWETLISFIVSQNNRIPRIKQIIKNISEKYGKPIAGTDFYTFPTIEELLKADTEGLMECKAGFRAKYILDAGMNVAEGKIPLARNNNMPTEDLLNRLMAIQGVGRKVADCVLLFGYGRFEHFPVDVWIKRVMEHFYFGGRNTKMEDIHALAQKNFGEYAGFAQQYLFHYARGLGEVFKN